MRSTPIRFVVGVVGFGFWLTVHHLHASAQSTPDSDGDQVNREIQWTEIPKVDREDPTLQRGIVFGPDGKPLAGAKVYAASNIELFEIRKAGQVTTKDLGQVRAVTDPLGRFEFHTPDLTWTPATGKKKRWEALLVVTKNGLAPGWIKTWGEDRGFRSHWNPHISKDVVIHLAKPATLRGSLLIAGDRLAGAKVKLVSVNIPSQHDLDKHIERLRKQVAGLFGSGVSFKERFSRPWLIPNLEVETKSDSEGNFAFDGLPQDHIVVIEVTHPRVRTTRYTAAVREMFPIARKPSEGEQKPKILLRGSGLVCELTPGVTLRGKVSIGLGMRNLGPAQQAIVALSNHNAVDGTTGKKFVTDDEGRFEITGLGPDYNDPGYEVAIIGSFQTPIESKRVTMFEDRETRIKVAAAVPYRLKLTDSDGEPISREVYSIVVQRDPGQIRYGVTTRYNVAVKVEAGVYEGVVPSGPGAVIVKRGSRRDRPAFVDPKGFFEAGRKDWTAAEARYAYGDQWQITQPGVIVTSGLAPYKNTKLSQFDLAAVVFTKGSTRDQAFLELAATVYKDDPPKVTLVDDKGDPVTGARVQRQLTRYNEKKLPQSFPLHGLHPDRPEFLKFVHDERGLIGSLSATLTDEPLKVVMKPAATIRGRIVDQDGKPNFDFGIRVAGDVPPYTYLGNYTRKTDLVPKGTFGIQVTPGKTYSGTFMRKTYRSWHPRPTFGQAFQSLTPKPGEDIDLGDVVVRPNNPNDDG